MYSCICIHLTKLVNYKTHQFRFVIKLMIIRIRIRIRYLPCCALLLHFECEANDTQI